MGYNLLINRVFLGVITHLVNLYQLFLGHPSTPNNPNKTTQRLTALSLRDRKYPNVCSFNPFLGAIQLAFGFFFGHGNHVEGLPKTKPPVNITRDQNPSSVDVSGSFIGQKGGFHCNLCFFWRWKTMSGFTDLQLTVAPSRDVVIRLQWWKNPEKSS